MSSPSPELCHIATFHTHYGALCFQRRLTKAGERAALAPVPRKLSVSCGTCVRFSAPFRTEWADEDLEAVYAQEGTGYRLLFRAEEE